MASYAVELAISMLVGGFIGYITNYIAVEMLFKPRKPVRIPLLNIKIQGVIPAKKAELAESLASIARDYFTGQGLSSEVARGLRETVRDYLRSALNSLASRNPVISSLLSPYIAALADTVADQLTRTIANKVAVDVAKRVDIARIVREEVERLSDREMEEIFRRIAGRELRYIEVMGFILGAVIGPIELLLLKAIP